MMQNTGRARIRSVVRKEFRHIFRDKVSRLLLFFMPGLVLLLFGYALSFMVHHHNIQVYNPDHSVEAERLFTRMAANPRLRIVGRPESLSDISGAFAKCVDMKDAYTNGHSTRVAHYTALLASRLGKTQEEVDKIYNIALLHDIGKISIPDNILNKPGKLTDEEFQVMKSHPSRGLNILQDVSIAPELDLGAGYHHEKYDGTGYPSGKKGDEIPQVAQIIAVADTFDAMYSTRPYRKKMSIDAVADELRRVAGKQLNPEYVELFLQLIREGEVDKIDKAYTTEPVAKVEAEQK